MRFRKHPIVNDWKETRPSLARIATRVWVKEA